MQENIEERNIEILRELEKEQEVNEIITNMPTEFNVDGRVLKVDCKTIKQMVEIDKYILKMQKLAYGPTSNLEMSSEEFWDEVEKKNIEAYETTLEVLFKILNKDTQNPEVPIEWIRENLDISAGGIGEQIIDAYNKRCSPRPLLKKILESRKF